MKRYAVIVPVGLLTVWTAVAQEVPRAETYLGYEHIRFRSAGTDLSAFSANGGGGQFIYNFNKWVGGVIDLGAVHNNSVNGLNLDSTFANALAGPRVSIRKWSRFTPYFQVMWGGAYATSSTRVTGYMVTPADLPAGPPVTARLKSSDVGFAMTAGGGFEIRISRHVAFRPIGLDYYLTRFQNLATGFDHNQRNLRYSTGLTFMFGGEKPTPAPQPHPAPVASTKPCPDGSTVAMNEPCPQMNASVSVSATPRELCAGERAEIVATGSGAPANLLNYSWTVNGQAVGQGASLTFDSTGRSAGTYDVGVMVSGNGIQEANASTTITVREYVAPTGTVQATPAQIPAGEKSSLSANFTGQCGGPIQAATYEASEGTVEGDQFNSASVSFDADCSKEQRKTVTITAKADDSRNTGTATTTIEVVKAACPQAVRLPDVLFSPNNSRVNNCGKRILLEQLRSYIERGSSGTVVLVGHTSSGEKPADLAQKRAMNAAAVITAGTGVCLSVPQTQVQISSPGVEQNGVSFESGFCQSSVGGAGSTSSEMRRVEVWFVPAGGQVPSSVTNSESAASLPVSTLGCPK